MKRIFQLICLLLVANCAMACSNTENDVPLGPIGETPAEEDPDTEHIYLWPEGNMPTETDYTVNNGNYQDDPDFRPYMVWYPVPDGVKVKGAVMVCPGGAFMFRSGNEGGVQVEEVAGVVQNLIKEGKVLYWGLSEASEEDIRRANAICPLTAVQDRYSMMARLFVECINRHGGNATVVHLPEHTCRSRASRATHTSCLRKRTTCSLPTCSPPG